MGYNNDPSRQFRESTRMLGETYSQSTQRARQGSKVKTYPIPRVVIGLMGLIFIKVGLILMDSEFHLSVKFLAFALFGSGIVIALHLTAVFMGFIITLSHQRLNRYSPKHKREKKKRRNDDDDPYSHI
ncbi:hypothetical protein [Fusibacter sp. JL216-2]|uniref:hypothetical protein n=1 Tax=Fusibacter sp. JL216-2 TaxID=3071453 RepID=UPI003D353FA4